MNIFVVYEQQTHNAIHCNVLCSLCLVGPVLYTDKVYTILLQTTVFVWIFFRICSGDKEWKDDDDKSVTVIANLC